MSREIPQAIRAVAGLAATVVDETLRLPKTLPSLPVRVIGLAMQATMKLQQHYTGLVARGDEFFTGLRGEREPGLATFDEDEDEVPPAPSGNGARNSAFDRAAAVVPDEEPARSPADDDELAEQVAAMVDDELSGLPGEPSPEEVVEALQDLTDQVQAADLAPSVDEAPAPQPGLTAEDALESALLEADGAPDSALVDGGTADAGSVDTDEIAEAPADSEAPATPDVPSDPGGSPVGEEAGAPAVDDTPEPGPALDTATDAAGEDVAADVVTEVDVLTPDGEVATVEGTVTDEGVAAVEAPEDTTGGSAPQPAAATGTGTGSAPVAGYDDLTIAQLRGRLRGYQLTTVADLLEYEQAHGAREPYLRMLRNRLEKLERQAVEASPLAPRGA